MLSSFEAVLTAIVLCSTPALCSTHAVHTQQHCKQTYAYLVQGPRLVTDARLTPSPCRHVYWLTFEEPPPDGHHLFMPGSTWTQGRNALLAHVRSAGKYDYFVFLDDDALDCVTVHAATDAVNPWDVFEERLAQWKPAVAYMSRFGHQTVDDNQAVTTGQSNVDAIVNAFHASTVGVLLPYDEAFDGVSWYYSQAINSYLVAAFYPAFRIGVNELGFNQTLNRHNPSKSYTRQTNFSVVKRYIRSLLVDGTVASFSFARGVCFNTENEGWCNWRACPRPGLPSYALNCAWVDHAINMSHPLAAGIKNACAPDGVTPEVEVYNDKCHL